MTDDFQAAILGKHTIDSAAPALKIERLGQSK
jgi:hypothetical protein